MYSSRRSCFCYACNTATKVNSIDISRSEGKSWYFLLSFLSFFPPKKCIEKEKACVAKPKNHNLVPNCIWVFFEIVPKSSIDITYWSLFGIFEVTSKSLRCLIGVFSESLRSLFRVSSESLRSLFGVSSKSLQSLLMSNSWWSFFFVSLKTRQNVHFETSLLIFLQFLGIVFYLH